MPSKSLDVQTVFERLLYQYGSAKTELTYDSPFQLLIAVILSAQCTDARVNQVTPELFRKYPSPKEMGAAKSKDIEKLIHSCGFFRQKTKSLLATSQDLMEKFQGRVPSTMDELVTLRGVGRKTASVMLNQAFDEPAIAVDTHVARVSQRLGWAKSDDPKKIEFELRDLLPIKLWSSVNGLLILHGRQTCKARKPDCENCAIREFCAFYRVNRKRT